ncbi:MAG: RagB/SusD family nutrient uptake outer membrane protein [Alistipes sp.]|nr:RagB/SusD family nutrient uptake outer membrane protein [Alistipes sp.]
MKRMIISALAVICAASLGSCIKEIDATGGTATEKSVTLETMLRGIPAAMVKAGSAGYAGQGAAWDFGYPAIHLAMESMTGDLVITGSIGYDWFGQWGTNEALGGDYAVCVLTWNTFYTWIYMANQVINKIGSADTSSLSAEQRAYLGHAYAYRAMFYFDLVRMYEFRPNAVTEGENVKGLGVPIVMPDTPESVAKNNPRASVEDIYNKVIFPDLDKAEELLSGYVAPDKYTIGSSLVYGLKARAWLERGTPDDETEDLEAYRKAAEYARLAINTSGCTPLTQDEWEDPNNGFNNANSNNSWIWALALPSESVSALFCFTAHMATESWSAYASEVGRGINKNLYNSIDRHDFRRHSWLDPDRSVYNYRSCRNDSREYFSETLKDYANIKFRPAQGNYVDFMTGGAADHCCMRVEEMYFIEAEAMGHIDPLDGAKYLNDFMNSYRMTDGYKYDCTNRSSTVQSFLNELMLQKRIEFWGEGVVMFDMKRLNMSSRRGYVGTNSPASYRLNCDGRAPYWNFVISRGESQNNTALADLNNPDPSGKVKPWTE